MEVIYYVDFLDDLCMFTTYPYRCQFLVLLHVGLFCVTRLPSFCLDQTLNENSEWSILHKYHMITLSEDSEQMLFIWYI